MGDRKFVPKFKRTPQPPRERIVRYSPTPVFIDIKPFMRPMTEPRGVILFRWRSPVYGSVSKATLVIEAVKDLDFDATPLEVEVFVGREPKNPLRLPATIGETPESLAGKVFEIPANTEICAVLRAGEMLYHNVYGYASFMFTPVREKKQ